MTLKVPVDTHWTKHCTRYYNLFAYTGYNSISMNSRGQSKWPVSLFKNTQCNSLSCCVFCYSLLAYSIPRSLRMVRITITDLPWELHILSIHMHIYIYIYMYVYLPLRLLVGIHISVNYVCTVRTRSTFKNYKKKLIWRLNFPVHDKGSICNIYARFEGAFRLYLQEENSDKPRPGRLRQ